MSESYKLIVEVSAETSLEEAKKQLQELVNLKKELSGKVDGLSDSDTKGISALIIKHDELSKELIKQQLLVEKLEQSRLKTAAIQDATVTKSLLNEAKLTKEINNQAAAKEKTAAKIAKAAADEESAYKKLSKQLNENKKTVKDLLASGQELSVGQKQLIRDTQELDNKLKEIDSTVGDNQRRVGAYREALDDVISEMGAFGGVITRVARTLKTLDDQGEKSTGKLDKLGNVLKAVGIGVALFAINALLDANKAANKMSEALTRASESLDIFSGLMGKGGEITIAYTKSLAQGLNVSLSEARTKFLELIDVTIKQHDLFREQQKDLQKLTLDQEDFNEISNNTTIGYFERMEAQKQSIVLGEKIAKQNIEIAKGELDLIAKEVSATEAAVGKGNANSELKDKLLSAQLKYNEAVDIEGDLLRQNAVILRQKNLDEAISAVELLRSKKLSFDQQSAQLEKQLKDEKNQISERILIARELLKVQNETTKEEIDLFKKKTGIQFNEQKLLNQTDAVKLANQLKSIKQLNEEGKLVGIGQTAIDELAKLVKEYQQNRIANQEELNKLTEEDIKKNQRLAQIITEIKANQLEDDIKNAQKQLEVTRKGQEDNQKEILESNTIFNGKKIALGKILIKNEEEQEDLLRDLRIDQLEDKAKADKINIENTISDAEIRASELMKIDKKLQIDLSNIQGDAIAERLEREKKAAEQEKEIQQAQLNKILERVDFISDKIGDELDKRSEKNIARIEKEQSQQEKSLDRQQERAEQGLSNELELQQRKASELEIQRQKEVDKQQRQAKSLAYWNLFSGYAKQDADTALTNTARDIAISEVITLAFKEKGGIVGENSDNTTLQSGALSRSHGSGMDRLIVADKREGILSVPEMNNLGGKEGFYNLREMLKNPISDEIMFPKVPQFIPAYIQQNNSELVREIKDLKQIMRDKPVSHSSLDNAGNVINTRIEQGVKHITKIISQKPNFIR